MEINRFRDYCMSHDEIYCYGAGKFGRIIGAYLHEKGRDICGYIVSKKEGSITNVIGVPVFSLEEYLEKKNGKAGIIVGMNSKYRQDVVGILSDYCINDYYCIEEELVEEIHDKTFYVKDFKPDNNITIFCYHRVADIPMDTWKLAVPPPLFDKQIRYIKENYTILRSDEEWGVKKDKKAAIITFDDGYEDIFTNALPILERHNVPATVFVCTDNLNSENEFWWDELEWLIHLASKESNRIIILDKEYAIGNRDEMMDTCYRIHPVLKKMSYKDREKVLRTSVKCNKGIIKRDYCRSMTEKQLNELSRSRCFTIGGHTVTHSCLANQSIYQQEWEIQHSKAEIEKIIEKEISVFSYPFGQKNDFTQDTVDLAIKHGYKRIFAAFEGLASDVTPNGYIPRINIGQEKDYDRSIRLLRYYETIYGSCMA